MYFLRSLVILSVAAAALGLNVNVEKRQDTSTTTGTSTTSSSTSSAASSSSSVSSSTSSSASASSSSSAPPTSSSSILPSSSRPPPSSSAPPPPPPSPAPTVVQLHPNFNRGKCLDVSGNIRRNGQPVQIYDCNGTGAQNWVINLANTKVQLAGTNFCLDAGNNPGNNIKMKIWQCYDNLPAQAWYYTDDRRIAVTGKG
ncbi:hypothetical protein HGRIS_004395 [Hohenbuehelia grisea]|uniref:Ricin B lectin domain-containing protein n=1 Tax=Hohenbuehelia grisea TaxID=104357 RepID=A0ABR3JCW7_9AGAR